MDTETFDERLEATVPLIERIVEEWATRLPEFRPVSVLHGPVPLAPMEGSVGRRYVAVWASHEMPDGQTRSWSSHRAWRWRWVALRHARRKGAELLIVRTAVKWAEALGR